MKSCLLLRVRVRVGGPQHFGRLVNPSGVVLVVAQRVDAVVADVFRRGCRCRCGLGRCADRWASACSGAGPDWSLSHCPSVRPRYGGVEPDSAALDELIMPAELPRGDGELVAACASRCFRRRHTKKMAAMAAAAMATTATAMPTVGPTPSPPLWPGATLVSVAALVSVGVTVTVLTVPLSVTVWTVGEGAAVVPPDVAWWRRGVSVSPDLRKRSSSNKARDRPEMPSD